MDTECTQQGYWIGELSFTNIRYMRILIEFDFVHELECVCVCVWVGGGQMKINLLYFIRLFQIYIP